MTNVLVIVANGSEEMETVIIVDVLRRAKLQVTLASLHDVDTVVCSRGVRLVADALLAAVDVAAFDAVVLPGGLGGAEAFAASARVHEILRSFDACGKLTAAVCAAPIALAAAGVHAGARVTSHPSVKDRVAGVFEYSEERVVVVRGSSGGNALLVTSRGPGTCFEFSLAIVAVLCGESVAADIAGPMMLWPGLAFAA
ncbi:Protein deglycase DJ-1zDJ-1 [Entophlyctis luteolus]|nr:Protein deglycase DJ-1zDJ-1 [Entophlyctis luteolus]KAJ3377375.1 Protein deglycase DJ-1zDJ-1 [Entophlyctis sp. JEL0112]